MNTFASMTLLAITLFEDIPKHADEAEKTELVRETTEFYKHLPQYDLQALKAQKFALQNGHWESFMTTTKAVEKMREHIHEMNRWKSWYVKPFVSAFNASGS